MYAELKRAQPRALKILENSIKSNRLSHAYLFTGPDGSYKKEMAYHFALMLYCKENTPCYECTNCKAILENRHLNVYYIEPIGQSIKKEQVLALQDEFSKTSLLEGPRIYIINEADTMSASAANSLLKFIEEPVNEQTYGILITKHKDNILSTIISRSMVINFDELDKNIICEKLTLEIENKVMIDSLCVLTSNYDEAIEMSKNESISKTIGVFEKYVLQLYNNNPLALFYRVNAEVLGNRENLKMFLVLLECFYRDIYEYQITNRILVYNSLLEEIKKISKKISSENILNILFQILELIKKIGYNVNMNLLLNKFLSETNGGV